MGSFIFVWKNLLEIAFFDKLHQSFYNIIMNTIPSRDQIPAKDKWDLTSIFENDDKPLQFSYYRNWKA